MTLEAGEIVTLDHHGKRRMGVVLALDVVPGSAVVAVGYGIHHHHDDQVRVRCNTRIGRRLRLYKDTSFYAQRTHIVPKTSIYSTGRRCPRSLLRKLEAFTDHAILNDYKRTSEPENRPRRTFSTGRFGVTLGDLINKE